MASSGRCTAPGGSGVAGGNSLAEKKAMTRTTVLKLVLRVLPGKKRCKAYGGGGASGLWRCLQRVERTNRGRPPCQRTARYDAERGDRVSAHIPWDPPSASLAEKDELSERRTVEKRRQSWPCAG